MAANGSSSDHSPTAAASAVVSSPWSQIVASSGNGSSDSVSDCNENGVVGNNATRCVWNKPSNEGSSSQLNPFISADSWPPLSESTRASSKSPSQSAKPFMDPSSSQGTGSGFPSPRTEVRDNVSTNNIVPAHPRPVRRSYSNQSSNGGHPPQLSVPQGSMASTGSHSNNSSPKEHKPRTGFVYNDHPHQHNSYRNRNGGSHHNNNYGRRRDQDRGNHEWYTYRNFNGRDNYMSPRFGPRFPGPPAPPTSALFPQPPLMQSFGAPIGFPELQPQMVYGGAPPPPPMDALRAVPFMLHPPIPPLHPMFIPYLDPQLHSKIVKQIDYYFSEVNLVKDEYLRKRMDDQGWVHINLVASFNKVKELTDSVHIILEAVGTSSVVELQGDKIRRRGDWERWPLSPVQSANVAGHETIEKLPDQVQNIALETTNNDGAGGLDVSHYRHNVDLNSQFLHSSSDSNSQAGIQVSDNSISARN
ncbi:putative winged helix-turn-helix DNA-binding domain-containing protein [Lupinus albus]|uniref:Putative winged helix-turn-helix DNA-binding domain-containing protein n=1 Tax=Lupinus albus TaxID=3870 RepID=A0A6A4PCU2_LUPAL|nr:putative winged helix-turn-helix DNA-binding domain-containing protein [Lupinus albus]